ncbi:MAG: hypothetical protein WCJ29_03680 [bacterium]
MKTHSHEGSQKQKAYVVAVNMGYGHERAAHGLLDLAEGGEYIIANDYPGIPETERAAWNGGRKLYEVVSRVKSLPLVGEPLFSVFLDRQQEIEPFYPKRDLSKPTIQVRQTYFMIEKLGLCRHLIKKLSKNPLPLIATFFTIAFAAEYYNYPGEIYLVVCDADMSRAWVSRDPKNSRIKYFAPTGRVVERLKRYGVPAKNIFHTGFPLPKSNVGGASMSIINPDLLERLDRLDPNRIFFNKYHKTLRDHFGVALSSTPGHKPIRITFAVGGAGAQKEIGEDVLLSLKKHLKKGDVVLNLVAGNRPEIADFFIDAIQRAGLQGQIEKSIHVLQTNTRLEYFNLFDATLRNTDVLWTKPSELSFFCGIGLPIIMAPTVGSQEEFNKRWLLQVGAGVKQNNPKYTDEWLFDWVVSGGLARLAWNGFVEAPTHGAYRIEDVINRRLSELEVLPMII